MAATPGGRSDIVEGEHTRRHASSQRPARITIRSDMQSAMIPAQFGDRVP
jgi:hypothetical protein